MSAAITSRSAANAVASAFVVVVAAALLLLLAAPRAAAATMVKEGHDSTARPRLQTWEFDPDSTIGDKVRIRETRPISKTVNWILTDILKKSST